MNKLVTGAIAASAGVALLLGGAGTFALWNDSQTVSGGSISTGTLAIAKVGTPTWSDISATTANGTTFDPSTQKLVPGDKVRLTQQVTISTTGKNLKANLAYDTASITNNAALDSYLTYTFAATSAAPVPTGAATLAAAVSPAKGYIVTPGTAATTTVDVTVTVEFKDTATDLVGQNLAAAINLANLKLTLAQVRP